MGGGAWPFLVGLSWDLMSVDSGTLNKPEHG
jgi:hypothetical protein